MSGVDGRIYSSVRGLGDADGPGTPCCTLRKPLCQPIFKADGVEAIQLVFSTFGLENKLNS